MNNDKNILPKLEEMTDIIDIEGILTLPWKIVVTSVLITLILIGLALIIWGYLRFKKSAPLKKQLSPYKKFLESLERLNKTPFNNQGDFESFYFYLSYCLRLYLHEALHYPAIDKTTHEILDDLKKNIFFEKKHIGELEILLKRADSVKFAKGAVSYESRVEHSKRASLFVEELEKKREFHAIQ